MEKVCVKIEILGGNDYSRIELFPSKVIQSVCPLLEWS